ncbi:hypothetical protein [Methylacidiphilum caldifontis]|uniref:CRISPR type III-B/RAMP module-associated protein Cmr5 n=1 Tax=Methylacidiphilum caldifontis TaxID=2795386 RepID=A0A4Y8PB15_9BACT|nr:hypothetical protein [Methylacidiphilum caldifontis]TFE67822.1 hypothetical protein A7Q10_09080 [Methylacidiphilum caldifontis]
MENLDVLCAIYGKKIADDIQNIDERLLHQALSVLQEQGVFAFFLFLEYKEGKKSENKPDKVSQARKICQEFLQNCPPNQPLLKKRDHNQGGTKEKTKCKDFNQLLSEKCDDLWKMLKDLNSDLNMLIFAHDLLLRVLTYALYYVRAKPD